MAKSQVLSLLATATLAAGLTSTACAGSWYALGAVGATYSESDYRDLVGAVNKANNTDTTNDESPWSFAAKVGAGYQFNDYAALEGAFYWLGSHRHNHRGTSGGVRHASEAEFSTWGVGIDAVGFVPVTDSVRLFGKAGAAWLHQDADNDADEAAYSFDDESARISPKLGLGLEWSVTEAAAIRFEYERFFNAAKTEEKRNGAIVSADTDINLFTIGLRYSF